MSSDSPAVIIFDELGNPVGINLNGTVYRLQTETIITDNSSNGPVAIKNANQAAMASDPALVVAISPNNSFTVNFAKPSISTTSSVAGSVSNSILLVSNVIRLGATVYNDSSALLYVKLGTIASITDFTIKLFPLSY